MPAYHPIYPLALVTLCVSALLGAALLYSFGGRTRRYLWLLTIALPFSTIANLAVKRPIGESLLDSVGIASADLDLTAPWWLLVVLLLLSPVVEESIKLLPLGLRRVRRQARSSRVAALWVGMALGFSYGIGEAGYLAWRIALSDQFVTVPWYHFVGFAQERLLVCFAHGLMTAVAVLGFAHGRRRGAAAGLLYAMGAHAALNLGAMLYQLDAASQELAGLWLLVVLIVLVAVFERLRRQLRVRDGTTPPSVTLYARNG